MKKKSIALFIAIIIMSLLCVNVYATISGDISLTPSETTSFSPGESFTVTLSLSELSGIDGIDTISGYINIDEDVLEDLTIESIVTNSDGQVEIGDSNVLDVYEASSVPSTYDYGIVFNTNPTSGKGDYKLIIDLEEVISSGTDLVTITYVIDSDAEIGTYEDAITYSSFVIYEGSDNKYAMEDKSIDITIVGDSTSTDDDDDTDTDTDSDTDTDETVTLEGIQLNITDTTLTLDSEAITLSASANPTNAELPDIIWTLSEEGIVEITDNGDGTITVTPLAIGTVTITATTEDGEFSATCEITVTESSSSDDDDNSSSSDDDTSTDSDDTSSSTDDDDSSSGSSSSDTDSDSSSSSSTDDDDTTASGSLPYTGIKLVLLPIVMLAVAGFVFYKKYAKLKDIK